MTVAKIYEQNPELVRKNGLINILQELLLKNKKTVVVANTLLALAEIEKMSGEKLIQATPELVEKILVGLSESSDWAQVGMLEILAQMQISDQRLAEVIVDRCLSRLQHINPAVILSSTKVILKFTLVINNEQILQGICDKIETPLTTLISKEDCSWVLLRNIHLLVEKFPLIFRDVRVFFVKYLEPSFVKIEKLKIIQLLTNAQNFKTVVNELVEYSFDLDSNFSRKAVQTLW